MVVRIVTNESSQYTDKTIQCLISQVMNEEHIISSKQIIGIIMIMDFGMA